MEELISLPFIGEISIASFSLPTLTVVLGLVDGFNPCAMWALVFLLTLLINTKDRKKIWWIGGTFILVSGIVYYLFMAAWLNAFIFITYIKVARWIIGLGAIAFGVYQVRDAIKYRGQCKVSTTKSRFKVIEKIKSFAKPRSLPASVLGVIFLAFSVNLIELLCSAGFPAIYTAALTLSDIPTWQYYLYILGYVCLFMFDDFLVFAAAVITMRMITFTEKISFYSNLIGGAVMVILGMLLIFKPEVLMF